MVKEKSDKFSIRVMFGFIAGFCSVLIFHQGVLSVLHAIGVSAATPFPYGPTKPFGLPQIWSLAFWGGIWGIVFALTERSFPGGAGYWLPTLIFGAIVAPALLPGLSFTAQRDTFGRWLEAFRDNDWPYLQCCLGNQNGAYTARIKCMFDARVLESSPGRMRFQ